MPVKVIKAKQQEVPVAQSVLEKIPVAAYCRVSTDSEEQETSYDAQVRHYSDYINGHPEYELVKIYADEGISGTSRKNRTQFNQMIKDCEAGLIKIVLTKSISRWARNTVDAIQTIRKLKELGIAVIFEKENINTLDAKGEVLLTIMSSIAQQESDSISKNVRLGIQYLMQQGKGRLNTSQFLGYEKDPSDIHQYVIVPEEADIVRRIYREYLEGFSPHAIATHLTEARVKTPAGKDTWYQSTVASILENEKYCGDLLMQKYYITDFLTHHIAKNDGVLPQYYVENHHPPIVPREIFLLVQGEMQRRSLLKYEPEKIRYGRKEALSGRLICGICLRTLKQYKNPIPTKTDWRCRRRTYEKKSVTKENQAACPCRIVLEREVKEAIIEAFNKLPEYRDDLIGIIGALRDGEIKRLDEAIEANRERQKRLFDRISEQEENSGQYLSDELEEAEVEETSLLLDRAEAAANEVKAILLLELVDQMIESIPKGKGKRKDPSCTDKEDFFYRTRYVPNKEVMNEKGRIIAFDDELVSRYLEKVFVKENEYEIVFKADLEIFVKV